MQGKAVDVPRGYVRLVRWAEGIFVVARVVLIPVTHWPPPAFVGGVVMIPLAYAVAAGLVWWGLRVPTRGAWWGALGVAALWVWSEASVFAMVFGAFRPLTGPRVGFDFAYLGNRPGRDMVAVLATLAQLVVIVAWGLGTYKRARQTRA
jgi:hypothetical protein